MTIPRDEAIATAERPKNRRLRRRLRAVVPFAFGIVAALTAVGLYGAATPGSQPLTPDDVNRQIASALASVTPPPAYSLQVYAAVEPALVLVQTQTAGGVARALTAPGAFAAAASQDPTSSAPAGPSQSPSPGPAGSPIPTGSLGSGVIVDTNGDILTCLHVVAGASSITVTFADGSVSPATVAASDPSIDIAVLAASTLPAKFTPAVLGNPRSVQVGSEAFVLGSPFGLAASMSAGVVSGLDRSFKVPSGQTLTGLIQVDAAVNPGNSGGPLVNRNGQVIGIVTGLINPTDQDVFIGIGLAVPIDVAGGAAGLPQY